MKEKGKLRKRERKEKRESRRDVGGQRKENIRER